MKRFANGILFLAVFTVLGFAQDKTLKSPLDAALESCHKETTTTITVAGSGKKVLVVSSVEGLFDPVGYAQRGFACAVTALEKAGYDITDTIKVFGMPAIEKGISPAAGQVVFTALFVKIRPGQGETPSVAQPLK